MDAAEELEQYYLKREKKHKRRLKCLTDSNGTDGNLKSERWGWVIDGRINTPDGAPPLREQQEALGTRAGLLGDIEVGFNIRGMGINVAKHSISVLVRVIKDVSITVYSKQEIVTVRLKSGFMYVQTVLSDKNSLLIL